MKSRRLLNLRVQMENSQAENQRVPTLQEAKGQEQVSIPH